jgi:hypothetical protein
MQSFETTFWEQSQTEKVFFPEMLVSTGFGGGDLVE